MRSALKLVTLVMALLLAGAMTAAAQDEPASTPAGESATETANTDQDSPDVGPVAPLSYEGPTMLSDAAGLLRRSLRFSIHVAETYDDHLLRNPSDPSPFYTEFAPALTSGFAGKRWRLGVSYTPMFRLTDGGGGGINKSSHTVNLNYTNQFSRRWQLSVASRGGYIPEPELSYFGNQSGTQIDPLVSPSDNLVADGVRTIESYSTLEMLFRKSRRTFFTFGAAHDFRQFDGNTLAGWQGVSPRASYNYRYSRKGTIAATYQYRKAWMARGFGQSESHAVLLGHSYTTRRWNFGLSVGPSYNKYDGLTTVTLSPLAALLLGTPTIQMQAHDTGYGVSGTASLGYSGRYSSFGIGYHRGINSGSGLFGSTETQSVQASYNLRFLRKNRLNLRADYSRASLQRVQVFPYENFNHVAGEVELSRDLMSGTSIFGRYRYFGQLATGNALDYERQMVTIGFRWAWSNTGNRD